MGGPEEADYIQLTGGSDLNPKLYGLEPHPTSYWTDERDARELALIKAFRRKKKFLGVCRGGQLLNIIAGGSMWQDISGHRGYHDITYVPDGSVHRVNSVHHQMMIPASEGADLLAFADGLSTRRENVGVVENEPQQDPEAIFYAEEQFLCFQPHPEFVTQEAPTRRLYFRMIDEWFA